MSDLGAPPIRLTPTQVRRLAYRGQHLSGPRPGRDAAGLLGLVRQLGCLQVDPISVVARTQLLVAWSRVGRFDPEALRRLQEDDHALFEYWAHAAALVASSDLPIHRYRMRVAFTGPSAWSTRVREWLADNTEVRRDLLAELEANGPLRTEDLGEFAVKPWAGGGWNDKQTVSVLLEQLSAKGDVLVARRTGATRWWDVGARCLPAGALEHPDTELPQAEVVRRATVRAIRALGAATATQITRHFTRGLYPHLDDRLRELVADGEVVPATVEGLKGAWYLHADDATTLDELAPARFSLLSPFDNLICDRDRTEALWGFRYRIEIYTPVVKRRYGYYVLPVLDGDRLVGRVDAATDPRTGRLTAKAVFTEPGVRSSARRTRALRARLENLARFVGAPGIEDPTGALAG